MDHYGMSAWMKTAALADTLLLRDMVRTGFMVTVLGYYTLFCQGFFLYVLLYFPSHLASKI
jgi:hypothetical protein